MAGMSASTPARLSAASTALPDSSEISRSGDQPPMSTATDVFRNSRRFILPPRS